MHYIHILGLGFLGLLFTSCKDQINKAQAAQQARPADVPVVTVQSTSLSIDHLYVTDIRAIRNVELRSKVSGFLEAIYVDEGRPVKKGQLLFRINDNEYRAAVAQARAKLNTAKAEARVAEVEYERVKVLTDKNIVSRTELDLASSKLSAANARTEEARSELENAQHVLTYTKICAPFDGIVDRIPLKAGSLLSEGTLITSVSDISSMYAYFDVSENEYLRHNRKNAGAPMAYRTADLILSDGQGYEYKGQVETVVSEFDESTGSISFRATFPNPKHLLKHKATGKVKLSSKVEDAVVVPQKATFELQDKNYVYILDRDNVIRMKSFVPSGRIEQNYIIKSGLNPGDRVVYEGIQDLKEGMKVNPRPIASGGATAAAVYK
jgi:membrane fusion protein (multidrug efflux system)